MKRCSCEHQAEGGPSTHRAPEHLSACVHSELRKTTKRFRPLRVRRVLGTRRLVVTDEDGLRHHV